MIDPWYMALKQWVNSLKKSILAHQSEIHCKLIISIILAEGLEIKQTELLLCANSTKNIFSTQNAVVLLIITTANV